MGYLGCRFGLNGLQLLLVFDESLLLTVELVFEFVDVFELVVNFSLHFLDFSLELFDFLRLFKRFTLTVLS